ncbi:Peptidase S1 domain-containing protein [Sergentomyia squamirostris]
MNLCLGIVIVIFLETVTISEGIYDPGDGGVKNRPIVRERLNRPYERLQQESVSPADQVTIHDQYSQVSMQRSGRHFGRSDNSNVMRIARPGPVGNRPYEQESVREPLALFQLHQPTQSAPQTLRSRFEPDVAENEVGVSYGTECPANATGHFPYVMDCRQYLNCWKGRGYIQSCSPGTLFNPETNVCDHPSKVVCVTFNAAPEEQERLTSKFSPRGQPQQPSGKLQFPPRTQSQNPQSIQSRGFTEEEVQCAPGSSGLTEHPYDCSKFLNCANGVTYIQDCGPGTVFNPLFNVCDWPHNVNCGSKSQSGSQSENVRKPYYGEGKIDMRGDPDDELTGSGSANTRGIYQRPQYSGGPRDVTTENPQSILVPSLDLQPPREAQNQWGQPPSYDRTKGSRTYSGGYNPQSQNNNPSYSNRKYPIQSRFDNPDSVALPSMELQPPVESPRPGQQSSQIPIYSRSGSQYPQPSQTPTEVLQPPPYSGQDSRQYPGQYPSQYPSNSKGRQEPESSTFVIGLIPPPPQDQVPENSQWSDNQQQIVNQWQLPWQASATQQPEVSVTFYPSHSRPYYNHHTTTPPSQQSQLNAALQMLLKPYMRGSQNTLNPMNFTNLLTTTPLPPMSGEQENLNQGGEWRPRPQGPTESGEEAHMPDGAAMPPGHSLEWHRAHPHVPLPRQLPDGRVVPHGHSLEWHQAHPDVALPGGQEHGRHHHHNRHGPHSYHHQHHGHSPHHRPHSHHHHQGIPDSTTPTTETLSTPPPVIDERFSVSATPEFVPLYQGANQGGVSLCAGQFNCSNDFCVSQDMICDGKNDCGNWKDESDCNHIGFEIRLSSDQGAAHEGRLEVKVYDQWGYVCDDKFDMRDANVICRELGFPLGAAEVRGNSYYPPHRSMLRGDDSAIFLVDELDCRGNEKTMRECDFSGWGVHDCNAEEVVGIVCKVPVMTCPLDYWLCDTSQECIPLGFLCDSVPDCTDHSDEDQRHCAAPIEVRLIGGQTNLEGRVEIKYRQIWGTVCDDDFNIEEANVMCRSLGFYGPSYVMKNTFGPGTGIIWLDQVDCIGNETSIEQCSHWHWGEHNCAHSEDVGIRCSHGEPTEYSVRRSSARNTMQFGAQVDSRTSVNAADATVEVQFPPVECGKVKVAPVESEWGRHVGYKVINGTHAQRGFHPWQAAIRVRGTGKSSHWCGAVLISEQHLLTAAHCLIGFSKGAYIIRLGDHHADVVEPTEVEVFIENLYIHEDFRRDHHMNNDIAIIVLKTPVPYTDHIQPICLPSKNTLYFPGMKCTISGWGSIQSGKSNVSAPSLELRAGTVPIISDDICREPHVYGNVISDGMFCAGSLHEGVDSCMGDSGGGLVCETDGVHKLYGIISWGQRCGYANKPGVYVKVSQYIDWIWSKLNGTNAS